MSLKGLKILLLIDKPSGGRSVESFFNSLESNVHLVENFDDAIQSIRNENYTAIFASAAMKSVSISRIVDELRAKGSNASLFILTDKNWDIDESILNDIGIAGILPKNDIEMGMLRIFPGNRFFAG